jgi:hypothetical protein
MMLLAATIVFTWIRRGTLLNRPATEDTAGARSRK